MNNLNSIFVYEDQTENINAWKKAAFEAARRGWLWTTWVKKSKFNKTDFATGLVAEVVMAWMIGIFKANSGIDFDVHMSHYWDCERKADFVIERFGMQSLIQMKFENDKDFTLPHDVVRVNLAAAPEFEGRRVWKDYNRGDRALYKLLIATGLFDEDEIYDFYDNLDIVALVKAAWAWIRN